MNPEIALYIVSALCIVIMGVWEWHSLKQKARIAELLDKLHHTEWDFQAQQDRVSRHMGEIQQLDSLKAENVQLRQAIASAEQLISRYRISAQDDVYRTRAIQYSAYETRYPHGGTPAMELTVKHGSLHYIQHVDIDLLRAKDVPALIQIISHEMARHFTKALHDSGRFKWVL